MKGANLILLLLIFPQIEVSFLVHIRLFNFSIVLITFRHKLPLTTTHYPPPPPPPPPTSHPHMIR